MTDDKKYHNLSRVEEKAGRVDIIKFDQLRN
jgi:hypothetical protein